MAGAIAELLSAKRRAKKLQKEWTADFYTIKEKQKLLKSVWVYMDDKGRTVLPKYIYDD